MTDIDLICELIERQEIERKRVAHAVHDGLGHQLLALKTAVAQARDRPDVDPLSPGQLDQIEAIATKCLSLARDIAYRLRPFELDQLGLRGALEALVTDTFQGTDLRLFQDLQSLPDDLAPNQRLHLFRLVQEALNNIVHHAHATTVMLEVRHDGDGFWIQIEDDGVGFDVAAVRERRAGRLGLFRMDAHARALGGELEVKSVVGRGTRVVVEKKLGVRS